MNHNLLTKLRVPVDHRRRRRLTMSPMLGGRRLGRKMVAMM